MLEHKRLDLEVKAEGEDGEFTGYGSAFWTVDEGGDRVAEGAFASSLKSRMPKMLWQHDPGQPIGKWLEAREDKNGLYLRGKLSLGTTQGRDAYALMKDGVLDGLSIGYRTRKSFNEGNVRVLKEIDLLEVSLVTFPMNPLATVTGMKSEFTERDLERVLRQTGFSRTEAKAITAHGFKGYQDVLRDAGVDMPEIDQRDADELKQLLETIIKGGRNG